ncbi:fimbria/pilus outer membrane usher protein [Escherichia coli]
MTWNAPVATVNGSYSQSSTYRQAGASVSGGIVAWSGGVNLANRLSETFAVMNAQDKRLCQWAKILRTTNRNGVVVYDGMTPYRENHLMLDVSQSDSEAELRGVPENCRPLSRRGCTG